MKNKTKNKNTLEGIGCGNSIIQFALPKASIIILTPMKGMKIINSYLPTDSKNQEVIILQKFK